MSDVSAIINQIIDVIKKESQKTAQLAFLLNKINLRCELAAGATGSKSQFFQDLFVLQQTQYKKNGFFVEFGATNGVEGSNTYILEKQYGWQGILAEPAKCWHKELEQNRSVAIDHRCVWAESGRTIDFLQAETAVLSTAKEFAFSDFHKESRMKPADSYTVDTISLNDLLKHHQAPAIIDYLSIDTEGSELSILSNFNFDMYKIKIITCEHNFSEDRGKIHNLLISKGYKLINKDLTDCDDWFVL